MIINKFDVKCASFPETKNDPPVGLDRDAPVTLEIPSQRMQPVAVQSQVLHGLRNIQASQDRSYSCVHVSAQQAGIDALVESLEPSIPEVLDHDIICKVSIDTYY